MGEAMVTVLGDSIVCRRLCPEVLPRLPVHAGGCVSLGGEVRRALVDVVHAVQERREPLLLSFLAACRIRSSALGTLVRT